ncbi:predicted protein [Naegleria gruberi]|uniref:Predicted protein n=1 Tax=Naegleria gruberi TaxID=5762 RepID=D2VJ73_NAEGR|nr:uncharacterized protein NAEGRDRAFT_68933 [Naegleria gruberi]EFC43148.1 predicted protein [Naegleria gruberi]|eukprot:XP_002675892.1 predicted protein [Naegleria gruberi strain NEG-M]
MFKFNTIYLLVVVVTLFIALINNNSHVNALQLQTRANSTCQVMINGAEVNIASIDRPKGYFIIARSDHNIKFLLNLCNASPNPYYWNSLCKFPAKSAGYQFAFEYNLCYSLSTPENPKVSYNSETKTVTITHPPSVINRDGVSRQMKVSLVCDRNSSLWPELDFEGEQNLLSIVSLERQVIFVINESFADKDLSICF